MSAFGHCDFGRIRRWHLSLPLIVTVIFAIEAGFWSKKWLICSSPAVWVRGEGFHVAQELLHAWGSFSPPECCDVGVISIYDRCQFGVWSPNVLRSFDLDTCFFRALLEKSSCIGSLCINTIRGIERGDGHGWIWGDSEFVSFRLYMVHFWTWILDIMCLISNFYVHRWPF